MSTVDISTLTYNGITYTTPASFNLTGNVNFITVNASNNYFTNSGTNITGYNNTSAHTYVLSNTSGTRQLIFYYISASSSHYCYIINSAQTYNLSFTTSDGISYTGSTNTGNITGYTYSNTTNPSPPPATLNLITELLTNGTIGVTTVTPVSGVSIIYGGNITNNCLLKGTKILTPNGYVSIEKINRADLVLNPYGEELKVIDIRQTLQHNYKLFR